MKTSLKTILISVGLVLGALWLLRKFGAPANADAADVDAHLAEQLALQDLGRMTNDAGNAAQPALWDRWMNNDTPDEYNPASPTTGQNNPLTDTAIWN